MAFLKSDFEIILAVFLSPLAFFSNTFGIFQKFWLIFSRIGLALASELHIDCKSLATRVYYHTIEVTKGVRKGVVWGLKPPH